MTISAPWRWTSMTQPQPDPAFAAWRGLADALRGRRYTGTLPIAPGLTCWFMEDPDTKQGAIVAWRDQMAQAPPASVDIVLAERERPRRAPRACGPCTDRPA